MLEDLYKAKYRGGISTNLIVESSKHLINDLLCKLCGDLSYETCLCLYCDSVYCNVYISRWLKRHKTCPECKAEYVNEKLQKTINDILNDKVFLKCLYYNNGCKKIVKYKDFFLHLRKCNFSRSFSPSKIRKQSPKIRGSNELSKSLNFRLINTINPLLHNDYKTSINNQNNIIKCSICELNFNYQEYNNHNNSLCLRKLNLTDYEELKS